MKIKFDFKKIRLVSFVFLFSVLGVFAVAAQDRSIEEVFPYEPIPEGAIEFEEDEERDRWVFTESTVVFFQEYIGPIFMAPLKYVLPEFDGPNFSYTEDFYRTTEGDIVIDRSLREDEVRDWMCKVQEDLDDGMRVNSETPFCTYAQDVVIARGNQGQDCLDIVDGDGYLFPLIFQTQPKNVEELIDRDIYDRIGRNFGSEVVPYIEIVNGKPVTKYKPRKVIPHGGMDLSAPAGIPIVAARPGIVSVVGWDVDGYGNFVILEHENSDGNNSSTLYAHMSIVNVKEAQIVSLGEKIGEVGRTGNSTGNHLHFEVRNCKGTNCESGNIRKVDPEPLIVFQSGRISTNEGGTCLDRPDYPEYNGPISSFNCMLRVAAQAVGNVPVEALYAISRNESTSCPATWAGWRGIESYQAPNGSQITIDRDTDLSFLPEYQLCSEGSSSPLCPADRSECTGDPLQIAHASRNLFNSDADIDVRGVSQFTAGTFNARLDGQEGEWMEACVTALGGFDRQIEVPPAGHECRDKVSLNCLDEFWGYDNKSLYPEKYSRHIVSHVVCAKTVKLRLSGGNTAPQDWTDELMYESAWDYYGRASLSLKDRIPRICDGFGASADNDYCDAAVDTFNNTPPETFICEGEDPDFFEDPEDGSDNDGEEFSPVPIYAIESPDIQVGSRIKFNKTKIVQSGANDRGLIRDFMNNNQVCAAINTNFFGDPSNSGAAIGLLGNNYSACPNCRSRSFINTAVVSYNGSIPPDLSRRVMKDYGDIAIFDIYQDNNDDSVAPSIATGNDSLFNGLDINWAVSGFSAIADGTIQFNRTGNRSYPFLAISDSGQVYSYVYDPVANTTFTHNTFISAMHSDLGGSIDYAILLDGGSSTKMYSRQNGGDAVVFESNPDVTHFFIGSGTCE